MSMNKKLCGPLAHWYVTKWPATANRFVTPAIEVQLTMQFIENCGVSLVRSFHYTKRYLAASLVLTLLAK